MKSVTVKDMRRALLDLKNADFKSRSRTVTLLVLAFSIVLLCALLLASLGGRSNDKSLRHRPADPALAMLEHPVEMLFLKAKLLAKRQLKQRGSKQSTTGHSAPDLLAQSKDASLDLTGLHRSDHDPGASAVVVAAELDDLVLPQNIVLVAGDSLLPEKPGFALVTACSKQPFHLVQNTLDSLLMTSEISEVVLLDWASEPSLTDQFEPLVASNDRFKLVRVNLERDFSFARALNLAATMASHRTLVFLSCEYELGPGTLQHDLRPQESGMIQATPSGSLVVIERIEFWKLQGLDERLAARVYWPMDSSSSAATSTTSATGSGLNWPMSEFLERARRASMQIVPLEESLARLVVIAGEDGDVPDDAPSVDASSSSAAILDEVEAEFESMLLKQLGSWPDTGCEPAPPTFSSVKSNSQCSCCSSYLVQYAGNGFVSVRAVSKPKTLPLYLPETESNELWMNAIASRANKRFLVPRAVIDHVPVAGQRELIMEQLLQGRKLFIAHVQHGLGNRLRALASAMAFARATQRVLLVVWEKDAHLQALYEELFEPNAQFDVISEWPLSWSEIMELARSPDGGDDNGDWSGCVLYNYMEGEEGAHKGAVIVHDPERHIYFRSSSVLNATGKLVTWKLESQMLHTLQPVEEVVRLVDSLGSVVSDSVGVHVRMELLADAAEPQVDYGPNATRTINYWRSRSHVRVFVAKMAKILSTDPSTTFYVASDTTSAIETILQSLPAKSIRYLARQCNDRRGECERYALADILLLSRTRYMLGSTWSSFTEAAQRLGGQKVLFSGKDFGLDEPEPWQ
ncbi:hypothetical protein FVE85_5459 [Porphyridium purpureum]|uniref:Glycosyltransferase 2-like domain-containing protein n=1 Tax=Porphyridium purpureum TaxID=35688 RepID=A0A5J4Z4K6_PORPP|nr:hypothetical protein FVE85_5459 [Porphyridium purpureum]|eukprot:POR1918..scf295_1